MSMRKEGRCLTRHRISPRAVIGNLYRLVPAWCEERVAVTAEIALVAGCVDTIAAPGETLRHIGQTATLILGEEYIEGFADGFNGELSRRRTTLRYVEGLDDGYAVGYAVRHSAISPA